MQFCHVVSVAITYLKYNSCAETQTLLDEIHKTQQSLKCNVSEQL